MTRKLSTKENERLWMFSAVPFILILIGITIYLVPFKSSGAISLYVFVFYGLFNLLICFIAIFSTYELLSFFKIKGTAGFHLKRFFGRMLSVSIYLAFFSVIWHVSYSLLSSLLSERYLILLTLLLTTSAITSLVIIPQTRRLLKKLGGEGYEDYQA